MRLILALCALICAFPAYAADDAKESAYDRVLRTGVIRCGYVNYPPHLIVDPNTKKMSGISYDTMEEAARMLGFKVEWAEELGWGNTVEAIRSGRIDMFCTSLWPSSVEGKYVGYTVPMFYSAVGAYVRADDKTIQADLENLNNEKFKISATDGNISYFIAQQDFPQATVVAMPNMTDETQMLQEVVARKADIAFIETYLGEKFIKTNPDSVKNIISDKPIRIFGNTFGLPMGDVQLKSMMDAAIVPLIEGGMLEKIIKKYEEVPNGILRVAAPYKIEK
jgi:polar amino acid transport system substrate-binding protein